MLSPSAARSSLVRPPSCRLVRPEWAPRVVSPAYDALSADERDELMASDPYVYLHVTRTPRVATSEALEAALEASAAALERLEAAAVFEPTSTSAYLLYRLESNGHVQTALVADVSLAAHDAGRILPHEQVRPQRAEQLAAHLALLRVTSSPVAFAHRSDARLASAIAATTGQEAPVLDFERGDGLRQTVWRVTDPGFAAVVEQQLGDAVLYVVDGHHRVAAALAHRALRRSAGATDPAAPHEFVLGALFAHSELQVAAFHRRVAGPLPLGPDELLARLATLGTLVEVAEPPSPRSGPEIGVYLAGRWHLLRLDDDGARVDELAVDVLHDQVLPLIGVTDAARDERLEYVPDVAGTDAVVAGCDRDGGVGFVVAPLRFDQLVDVVDRGAVLPPKSTYFTPKVRSGVFLCAR